MRITFKNRQIKNRFIFSIVCMASLLIVPIAKSQPVVKPVVQNTNSNIYSPFHYAGQKIQGRIGDQMNINIEQGLLGYDLNGYFNNYKIKGGIPGEFLGKYIQADCKMYQYTGRREIREQMDSIIAVWLDFQRKNDGFLSPGVDWKDGWVVWEHKYVLLGLLEYYGLTKDSKTLDAARWIGDNVIKNFGGEKAKVDILASDDLKLAATSILEPMTYLYQYTGDQKYLQFCLEMLDKEEEPKNGTFLISEMTRGSGDVLFVGGRGDWQAGKSYEMISNYIGIVNLYKITGEPKYLESALKAWESLAKFKTSPTGTSSNSEYFREDNFYAGATKDHFGEGCVTAYWLYFNRVLFYLTGQAKFMDEVEKTLYNSLLGSQNPQTAWQTYYTPLDGQKEYLLYGPNRGYSSLLDAWNPPCCITSVTREIARIPEDIWALKKGGMGIFLYTSARVEDTVMLNDGSDIGLRVSMETDFPKSGKVVINVDPLKPARFRLALRVPYWTSDFKAKINGELLTGTPGTLLEIDRNWMPGTVVEVNMNIPTSLITDPYNHCGYYAVKRGPQILSADQLLNPKVDISDLTLQHTSEFSLADVKPHFPLGWVGTQAYTSPDNLTTRANQIIVPFLATDQENQSKSEIKWDQIILVPFADAGQLNQSRYITWIKSDNPKYLTDLIQDNDKSWQTQNVEPEKNWNGSRTFFLMKKSGAYIHTSFKGIGVKVYCFKKNGAGSANITLDGRKIHDIKWGDDFWRFDALLWESGPLEDKEHTLQIDFKDGEIWFDYLKILRVNTEFDPSRPATAENPINASGNLVW